MTPAQSFNNTVRALCLVEIVEERDRQEAKFGENDHPSFDIPKDIQPEDVRLHLLRRYILRSEEAAKRACEDAFADGRGSMMDILVEEVSEVLCAAGDESQVKAELIQVAAVCVKWIEAIERRKARAENHPALLGAIKEPEKT